MNKFEKLINGIKNLNNLQKLKKLLSLNRPLKVKLGIDPTRPDLTFGHMVVLNKIRQFQDLGHQAVLVIGDYTATIGDPSGQSKTRIPLTFEEVRSNANTYLKQVFQIIDKENTTVFYNSQWFNKMKFQDAINLASKMTVARILERNDFSKRHKSNNPIAISEFLYPLLQGYDSVMLQSDIEIGGNDQLFNLLIGKALQKEAGQFQQVTITTPLLLGLDGVRKMSKSLNNSINFNDSPKNMFGKIMSISDAIMWSYYELLTDFSKKELLIKKEDHPMKAKKCLAYTLVQFFYGSKNANQSLAEFEKIFSKKQNPEKMIIFNWHKIVNSHEIELINLLLKTQIFASKKELRRLISQGAITIDNEKCFDIRKKLIIPNNYYVIKVGKLKFLKFIK